MTALTTSLPQTAAPVSGLKTALKWLFVGALGLSILYLIFNVYATGQPMWALGILILAGSGFFVYLSDIAFAYRYLFPGLASMAVFVAFPMFFTAQIGFTNYSSAHLLSKDRATSYLLEQGWPEEARTMGFSLHRDGDGLRVILKQAEGAEGATPMPSLVSPKLDANLKLAKDSQPQMVELDQSGFTPSTALPLNEVIERRDALQKLTLIAPDKTALNYAGVREFAPIKPVWQQAADGTLTQVETGATYKPNMDTGYFENAKGEALQPGFKVGVGLANYMRMVTDPDFRGPFFSIFLWTVMFSGLTVLFTVAVGMPLAVLLNWEALQFKGLYRTLLFLPYAVPAFISILVFKGLFNQNFGEINVIFNALFGTKPAWFADPLLAKIMILIVNTWLGYPYIMIICSGLIKAIPSDLYEASAVSGASPWVNFVKITAPLIIKPLTPLLITVFAFNFNNFVVIALLTDGRPDYLNTKLPAGTTDILVSYTYRIAFQDSGQNFGLASAISTVIFAMVAALSLANMKLAKMTNK